MGSFQQRYQVKPTPAKSCKEQRTTRVCLHHKYEQLLPILKVLLHILITSWGIHENVKYTCARDL